MYGIGDVNFWSVFLENLCFGEGRSYVGEGKDRKDVIRCLEYFGFIFFCVWREGVLFIFLFLILIVSSRFEIWVREGDLVYGFFEIFGIVLLLGFVVIF